MIAAKATTNDEDEEADLKMRKFFSRFTFAILGAGLAAFLAFTAAPESALARATVTKATVDSFVFVPCANDGNGEFVSVLFTLHLVDRGSDGPPAEIGVWSHIRGVGLVTGDRYVGNVVSVARPGSDDYLTTISINARGRGGAHFTQTSIGPLLAPPTEIRQMHCH